MGSFQSVRTEEDSSAVNVLLSKCQRPYFVVCESFQIARVPVTTVIPEELIKLLIKMVPASVEGLRSMQESLYVTLLALVGFVGDEPAVRPVTLPPTVKSLLPKTIEAISVEQALSD